MKIIIKWVSGGFPPRSGRWGGDGPPGLEPVGSLMLGNGAVEEAVVWQDSTQTYRSQPNPKIMLSLNIYSNFSSTIVRDFFFPR